MTGALLIGTQDGERRITPEEAVLRIGRDPLCQIVIEDPRVSREHVEVQYLPGGWRLRDLGSRNGTYAAGTRVDELNLTGPCQVRLGAADGPSLTLRPESVRADAPPVTVTAAPAASGPRFEAGRVPSATYRAAHRTRIGRAPDNDIVLDDLQVSRHHAELLSTPAGVKLVDLGTRNGTFVNGRRISEADLRQGDLLSLRRGISSSSTARSCGSTSTPAASRSTWTAWGSPSRVASGLLDKVSFALGECSLLAVVGPERRRQVDPAGRADRVPPGRPRAPSSTTAATSTATTTSCGSASASCRRTTSCTRQLTVRPGAAIRGRAAIPARCDARRSAERRIDEVVAELGLTSRPTSGSTALSGGQRKRTSAWRWNC